MLWNFVEWGRARTIAQNSFDGFVSSDLANSYAWDTAIVFIQMFSGNEQYASQTSVNKKLYNTGFNNDKVCNIHDMASNCLEWNTEYCSKPNTQYVWRGGSYNSSFRAGGRSYYSSVATANISFRVILHVK